MRHAGRIALALAVVVVSAGAVAAADIPVVVAPEAPAAPPPPPPPTFDWGGVYVGVHLGYYEEFGCGLDEECDAVEPGVQFGFNVVKGSFLFGAEGNIGFFWNPIYHFGSPVFFTATARGGLIAGDNLLVYLEAGIWRYLLGSGIGFVGGLGLEYAVSNTISIFGEAKAFMFDGDLDEAVWFQVGVNYHIGNGL